MSSRYGLCLFRGAGRRTGRRASGFVSIGMTSSINTAMTTSSSSSMSLMSSSSSPSSVAAAASSSSSTTTSSVFEKERTPAVGTASAPGAPVPGPDGANIVDTLLARGLLDQCTGETSLRDAAKRRGSSLRVYCGFDPTADSLHLGNLLGIIVLRWFQLHGHQPVALLGGATARVGDPSGKSLERPVLAEEAVDSNAAAIERTLRSMLAAPSDSSLPEPLVLNNLEWYGGMRMLDFLSNVGRRARVGVMLAKDSVRSRMEGEGMSYTEFTYQLLQGFDYVHLAREYGVAVQVGGSDQWGNITAGTDLLRRFGVGGAADEEKHQEESDAGASGSSGGGGDAAAADATSPSFHGATFPLLLKSDGTKFGKSETGAVWLSAERLSPYNFYQYLLGVADADVGTLLRRLTFVPLEEIDALERGIKDTPQVAQKRLAEEVTRFVHGDAGLEQAMRATAGLAPGKVDGIALDIETLRSIANEVPLAEVPRQDVEGAPLVDVMVSSGLQQSKGAARRLIANGGGYINNVKVTDAARTISEEDILGGEMILLGAGKKNKKVLRVL